MNETRHQYFRRLQSEEEAGLRISNVHGRALNVERLHQMGEEAEERNRRQDEVDREEAERR